MHSSRSSQRCGMPVWVLLSAIALVGCGGGAASPPAPTAQPASVRPVEQSDLQIAQLLFAGSPRTPDGFALDAAMATPNIVATSHLKNTDIDTSVSSSQPQYELCTDDWNAALGWSETSAQNASLYADLVETNDAAHYFEFGRVRSGDPQISIRQRVFKCAYLDRSTADLHAATGTAGKLNQLPLTATTLRELSEYLWQFTLYNNVGHAVLKSSGAATAAGLEHTLTIADLVHNGISATCDRINVIAWRHSADAITGELQLSVQTLFSFGARDAVSVIELCDH